MNLLQTFTLIICFGILSIRIEKIRDRLDKVEAVQMGHAEYVIRDDKPVWQWKEIGK